MTPSDDRDPRSSRALSDRHDAAVFSSIQDGPAAPPDPAEVEQRRVRLLAGAQSTLLTLSDVLTPLAREFDRRGHELYLVGGSVRDAVLGRLGTDLDFTTDARPDVVMEILTEHADAVWDTGIDFGTVSAALRDAHGVNQQIASWGLYTTEAARREHLRMGETCGTYIAMLAPEI